MATDTDQQKKDRKDQKIELNQHLLWLCYTVLFCCNRGVLPVTETAPSDFARQTCGHVSMVDSFVIHGLHWDHLGRKHAIENLCDHSVEPKQHQVHGNTFEVFTEHD